MVETLAAIGIGSAASASAAAGAAGAAGTIAGVSLPAIGGVAGVSLAPLATGGTAAGASLFSLANVATAASLLSGGFSMLHGIQEGRAQSENFKSQAEFQRMQSRQEALRGMQESNIIKERLLRQLSTNRAVAGASGFDINSSTVKTVQSDVMSQANEQLSVTRAGSRQAQIANLISANNLDADATNASQSGFLQGGASLFSTADKMLRRGGSGISIN